MNVVHLYDGHERVYDGRGSVPDVVWSLATRTAGRGHEVTVIERKWAGLPTEAEHGDVAFSRLDLRTGADEPWENIPYNMIGSIPGAVRLLLDRVNFARRAYSRLRSLNYDVVHVHLPFAANVLVTVAPWLRDRMVYTAHLGETESRVEEPTVSPDVYLAKRTARTIALNPKIRRAFADRGVSRDRLAVVPNGVDVSRFTDIDAEAVASVREAYDITGDPVVLFVGTLTPRKGVTELVEAAARVLSRHGGPELLLVGRTDLEPQYVSDVGDLSGGELQRVSVALALARDADVYLLDEPSAYLDVRQRTALGSTLRDFVERTGSPCLVIEHDLLLLDYLSDRAMVFEGEPARRGIGRTPQPVRDGINRFLETVGVTFRTDPDTGRPRANKPGSRKDGKQKRSGTYYAT